MEKTGGLKGIDGLMARGIVRLWTDDLSGARADLSQLIANEQVGEPLRVSQAVGFLSEAAFRMGLLDEAVEQASWPCQLRPRQGGRGSWRCSTGWPPCRGRRWASSLRLKIMLSWPHDGRA